MRASRADWLIFLALGFMWGSSYLFIKIAVDDFGTFTLVALRLAIGALLLWTVVRLARQRLPREAATYGHLVVMAILNIALPFALITWAEQGVDSSLAAVLTGLVPLFVAVLAPLFIPDEPLRAGGVVGLVVGFLGVIVLTSRGLGGSGSDIMGDVALVGSSVSYAAGGVYTRRYVRKLPPMIPAVFQVTIAFLITGTIAIALERPWDARPDLAAVFAIVWLGLLGSGLAYLAFFRLLSRWGATRTALVAYVLPVVGIALGFVVLGEPIDARMLAGTALIIAGVGVVNGAFGRLLTFVPRSVPKRA
ncbi:MAG TPA: DMT family transporter [Candidatus Limnocylindria bacterium]|nr:DMT family transporter [Candidatus Limnocylindria bacterium]